MKNNDIQQERVVDGGTQVAELDRQDQASRDLANEQAPLTSSERKAPTWLRKGLVGAAAAALAIGAAFGVGNVINDSGDAGAGQEISVEVSKPGSETGGGEAAEAGHSESGGGETGERGGASEPGESGTQYGLNQTFDEVQSGARLILSYDAATNTFNGTVENTTNNVLDQVRVEVHLSNGVELGPTTPVDLAPGQVIDITLPATNASFTSFSAHPEVS